MMPRRPRDKAHKLAQLALIPDKERRIRSRIWGYKPQWYFQRFSPTWLSSDEYGRRTFVIGWCVTGQLVIAFCTCFCEYCDESRRQTFQFDKEEQVMGDQ